MSNRITDNELAEIDTGKRSVKTYSTPEITVYWQPDLCIHSANCVVGLPPVFNAQKRPWIRPEKGSTEEIITTINTCPSRALLYQRHNEQPMVEPSEQKTDRQPAFVKILADGPLLISGNFTLRDANNKPIDLGGSDVAAICRCGASARKPFCDGTHVRIGYRDDDGKK